MFNEKMFINRVLELVESSKHQREGVGLKLVEEFNLPGKHKATRLVQEYFNVSLSSMLKLRFEYPDTWMEMLPLNAKVRSEKPDLYTRVLELRKVTFSFKEAKSILMQEYNLSEMELVRRIRSFMQKPLSEVFFPNAEEIQECLIRASTAEEFKTLLGISTAEFAGFFDKNLGVANFTQAKARCLYKMKIPKVSPCTADNEAIVISQFIGDGSYCKARKALKITHGIKQLGYLRFKVSLLVNAYPQLYSVDRISCLTHTQGHEYCNWYSGKLPEHITNKLENWTFKQLINSLTPLGILLLFLDDGCLYWKDTKVISFCIGNDPKKHRDLQELLATYDLHSNITDTSCVIARQVDIVKFINLFIKPYIDIVPECLKYKTEIMI